MQHQTLQIKDILVEERQRQDYGDLDDLAKSLERFGLIQPIVVTAAVPHRLIAGGRRLAAATKLGWTEVHVVFRESISEDEWFELELEENIRRKDMSWQERALNIARIHDAKVKQALLEGSRRWIQQLTGEMFNMTAANVNYLLTVARRLRNKNDRVWQCGSAAEAWRMILQEREDAANAELARRSAMNVPTAPVPAQQAVLSGSAIPQVEFTEEAPAEGVEGNPLGTVEVAVPARPPLVVPLSSMLYHGDCIEVMSKWQPELFDHCLTDPPYGIDMEMLAQDSGHMDVSRTEDEHDVGENEALHAKMFPAIYRVLKPNAFAVFWCDIMQWAAMAHYAKTAGFKVQRWPLIWHKTHQCKNEAAQYNFTKNFELAMVCRKGNATLVRPATSSVFAYAKGPQYAGYHPFFKPLDLWCLIADHIAIEGQTILDPFCGEGSCPLAVLGNGLKPIGIEKRIEHYNSALENLKRRYLAYDKNAQFS